MAYLTGIVDDTNGQFAHYNLLTVIYDLATTNGWQAIKYDTSIANRELILKGTGYSGNEEIYLCFYCYQNPDSDYYNLAVGVALGYVPSNAITQQPNVFSQEYLPIINILIIGYQLIHNVLLGLLQ